MCFWYIVVRICWFFIKYHSDFQHLSVTKGISPNPFTNFKRFSKQCTWKIAAAQRVFSFLNWFNLIIAWLCITFIVSSGPANKVKHPPHTTLLTLGNIPKCSKIIDFDRFSELCPTFWCVNVPYDWYSFSVHTDSYALVTLINRILKLSGKFEPPAGRETDCWEIRFWKKCHLGCLEKLSARTGPAPAHHRSSRTLRAQEVWIVNVWASIMSLLSSTVIIK